LLLLFVPQVDKWKISDEDKIKCSLRIAHYLLPWLKDLFNEQMKERRVEATIEGIITVGLLKCNLLHFQQKNMAVNCSLLPCSLLCRFRNFLFSNTTH
jgi:hypothetical protein